MSIIQPFHFAISDDPDLLARVREGASALTFAPRGTIRCQGQPLFRNQAARDAGCLLDLDATVVSWTCLPTILHHAQGMHVPDFAVVGSTGAILVDAVPADAKSSPPHWVADAARDAGYRYEVVTEANLHGGFRLDNARDLLRYAAYHVSLGDRVRLLAFLDEHGAIPLAACMQAIGNTRDAIGVIAAMVLRRFIEIDLDEARIGPETRVSRFRV